jgi:hypothetical protein
MKKRNNDSGKQIAAIEVDWMYIEGGFLCH